MYLLCVLECIFRFAMYCLNGLNLLGTLIIGKRKTGQNQLNEFGIDRSHPCEFTIKHQSNLFVLFICLNSVLHPNKKTKRLSAIVNWNVHNRWYTYVICKWHMYNIKSNIYVSIHRSPIDNSREKEVLKKFI